MGYPSWKSLAMATLKLVPPTDPDYRALTKLIDSCDFPEVFERMASRLGGIENLLTQIRPLFKPQRTESEAYTIICDWPFRCYLTTNYDDEIGNHLRKEKEHFTVSSNSQADLSAITAQSMRRIVKLHGDLNHGEGLVLTTDQYTAFETGGSRQYFRNKLISIFQMVPVVIIGHSMSDRDFKSLLRLAKESASPNNPIYTIVADVNQVESDRLLREFNIRVLSYPNPNGDHSQLIYLLRQINRFVVPRTSTPRPPLDFPDSADAQRAVALYVHSALGHTSNSNLIQKALQPQVLSLAASLPDGIPADAIAASLTPKNLGQLPSIREHVDRAIQGLTIAGQAGLDYRKHLRATDLGKQTLANTESKQLMEEDQFYGAIRKRLTPFGTSKEVETLVSGLKLALIDVFRRRGLAASELLFRGSNFEPPDMPELFEAVFPRAASVDKFELRAEYCDAVMDVLTAPNDDQRSYLAHLAQGFFAYHMFGLDPTGQELRRIIAQETAWILDSNVLIPLVALESVQHKFIFTLIRHFKDLGLVALTTNKLVSEVDRSLGWMQERLRAVSVGSERGALLSIVRSPDYTANPFVESYITGHVSGRWRSMPEFLAAIGFESNVGMRGAIVNHGIEVIDPASIDPGCDSAIANLTDTIHDERKLAHTDRAGQVQAKAEGEVLHVLRHVRNHGFPGREEVRRAYFVSSSRLLDMIYGLTDGLITWYPETLFNHLSYVKGEALDPDSVFRGIISSFYRAGISVIDEPVYRQCFKPAISEANANLKVEIDRYVESQAATVQEQQRDKEALTAAFERTPAIEKSLFVEQMGWKSARIAEDKLRLSEAHRAEAERKAKQSLALVIDEYKRKERERTRHEEGRRRNLKDPKHLAKRKRQARRRKKKR